MVLNLSASSLAKGSPWSGSVVLEGSKSISNRVLIAQAMSAGSLDLDALENLSPSDDTQTLKRLLQADAQPLAGIQDRTLDAGAAGTTFRFLTAFLARREGTRVLTGSARMLERPIRILVDALRELGAEIEYLGREGYPPLRIRGTELRGGRVRIPADVSSQYISALLLIGPALREGLELELVGKVGSKPYIGMTLRILEHFGAVVRWEGMVIRVAHSPLRPAAFRIESDWSAASYYYSIVALSPLGTQLAVSGLDRDSYQGDAALAGIYDSLGVRTVFSQDGVVLTRSGKAVPALHYDFSDCPDLAQTVVVTCGALGVAAQFNGLESLRIKETDRTAALQKELKPFGVRFQETSPNEWTLSGKVLYPGGGSTGASSNASADASFDASADASPLQPLTIVGGDAPLIRTYEDHRMAMAFAPLALVVPALLIQEPDVVRKSYPGFWSDLRSLGFETALAEGAATEQPHSR
ncbi:MAG: 3-phosphoshikimate 1-carboxyvinyltransferase [Bacteroidetes bacterium]|nr:3-phosphoshikimate 1-carboxyvinyltransferase [Bacteroidota bacterium]